MPLACTGVNHRTASVALRERLALGPVAQQRVLHESRQDARAPFTELAILSTCNRTEVYAELSPQGGAALAAWLAAERSGDDPEVKDRFYIHEGDAALQHLFRVACGDRKSVV